MVVCQHVLQGVSVVHVATAPSRRPWRPWRTSSALRRDRDEQQLQRFGCQSCRCRAVHAAATQSQEATLRQQTDQGTSNVLCHNIQSNSLAVTSSLSLCWIVVADLNAQPDPRYEGVAWVDDQGTASCKNLQTPCLFASEQALTAARFMLNLSPHYRVTVGRRGLSTGAGTAAAAHPVSKAATNQAH